MAKDKYKIRLSGLTYYSLRDDMYAFNFIKENGMPNQNNFYNKLISGFYSNFKYRQSALNDYICNELSFYVKYENKLVSIADNLNTKINEIYHSDFNSKYHNFEIYIYPTKETIPMYDEIENNALNKESMSEFIRNLLNEYVKAPFFERERCLYWNHIVKIKEAISEQKVILIKNTRNTEIYLQPLDIFPSAEETYNYVVGKNITNNSNANFSIKLSRIKSITILNKYYNFSREDYENFKLQLLNGPEFMCKETKHAVVKFSKEGIKKFDSCYKDRPVPTDYNDETGEYIFDTNLNKLYLYLLQFVRHVKIIEPKELKNKLNSFHKLAIDEDE